MPPPNTTQPTTKQRVDKLLAQIDDPKLKRGLEAEFRHLESRKKYGLVWEDRPEKVEEDLESRIPVLTPIPSLDVVGAFPRPNRPHLLIEGDNLHALTVLQHTHKSKIDVIAIDPPYNTGKEFVYNDRLVNKDDQWCHSAWLSFMSKRLRLARELLKDEGVIFIHIDDNEQAQLKLLCDQVFGDKNFVGQVVWDGGAVKNNARFLCVTHEYALVYHKKQAALLASGVRWRTQREGYAEMMNEYNAIRQSHGADDDLVSKELTRWLQSSNMPKRLRVFNRVDARGPYTAADLSAPGGNGGNFDLIHPATGKPCVKPSRGWGYRKEVLEALVADDRIIFGSDETKQPLKRLYLRETSEAVYRSVVTYPARRSTHTLEHMIGREKFNNPKNLEYIQDLIRLTVPSDGVVLDFFAGSGTTGHAVAALNKEDGGTRQAILVTNNENNICRAVTQPRMKAVLTGAWSDGKTHDPLPGSLKFYKTGFVKKSDS